MDDREQGVTARQTECFRPGGAESARKTLRVFWGEGQHREQPRLSPFYRMTDFIRLTELTWRFSISRHPPMSDPPPSGIEGSVLLL